VNGPSVQETPKGRRRIPGIANTCPVVCLGLVAPCKQFYVQECNVMIRCERFLISVLSRVPGVWIPELVAHSIKRPLYKTRLLSLPLPSSKLIVVVLCFRLLYANAKIIRRELLFT
jgi:hypothetical protein